MQAFEREFEVRGYEAGPDRVVEPYRVAEWFQDAAARHARRLGFSMERLWDEGYAWVLARALFRFQALPEAGAVLKVRTWPSGVDKYFCYRDAVFTGADGGEVVRIGSAWVALDMQARRMTSVPDWLARGLPEDSTRELEFDCRNLPKLEAAQVAVDVITRLDDLDSNGHVNNAKYMAWVLAPFGREDAPGSLASLDIMFRAEARAGEALVSDCAREADGAWLHRITRVSDGRELIRARSRWR
ncbi:MAG: acyl-[acyl-carrier-protein] thioesterase [Desulfovibrionaceae bacterium]